MALDARFYKLSEHGRPTEFGTIFEPSDEWLAKQSAEAVFESDLPIVDSHHHLWEHPYVYDRSGFEADIQSGHHVEATVYVECGAGYRDSGPVELRPVGETEYVAAAAGSSSAGVDVAAGIVGFADLTLGAAVEPVLTGHMAAGRGRFRGVRFSTGWNASPEIANTQSGKRPGMLREAKILDGARVLARNSLTLDAWLFHTQLDDVAALADAVPDLKVVVNHSGGPLGYGRYASDQSGQFDQWRDGIRQVAKRPNVWCKIGGLVARGAMYDYLTAPEPPGSDELARLWSPWLEVCAEEFGAKRCMFESNFPVDKMGTSYRVLWNAYKRFASSASREERELMFGGSARKFYSLL
ncbi:hypothetical protein OPAG_05020 [Rhodococcus opacus PD630]|uniref:amidohydrolase family protein n=1 Tax=Rhodococcus opacus TaxID=37919 RepID=UPI00029CC675|nr:amidohydrolase family protein [Rhodococcus opacus]AHK31678.1 Uncharacterized protein y4mH [Rhodococcus opacus PD630]EHI44991.1 hypothetical protein OPAG_05020 [Rhodococcus opacus PD630]KXF54894.1 amidohydrolase [Rhodococcus sp. SC4]UDG94210.1 amidohydrolase [Rhodococcus opacus PD630]